MCAALIASEHLHRPHRYGCSCGTTAAAGALQGQGLIDRRAVRPLASQDLLPRVLFNAGAEPVTALRVFEVIAV